MRLQRSVLRRSAGRVIAGLALMGMMAAWGTAARAQAQEAQGSIVSGQAYAVLPVSPMMSEHEGLDVLNAMRNVLVRANLYYSATQRAITIRGSQGDVEIARKMLAELDRPRKAYRLTYMLTLKEGTRTVDTRRYSLVVTAGGQTELKQGSRVPVVTGTTDAKTALSSQVQYVDVGLKIAARLDGERLRTTVEETKVAEEKSSVGPQDPVVEQTVLDGDALLVVGKPVTLGKLAVPNSGRQMEVAVTAEEVE